MLALVAACTQAAPTATDQPTPTPLPTPVVLEQPVYTVQRGAVVQTLSFTGRVSPVTEQELFFRTEGVVTEVFVARGDGVTAGAVLAQLDIDELQSQLDDARLSLRTAELNLSKAERDNADALVDARNELANAQLRLEQAAVSASSTAVAEAEVNLSRAEQNLADAEREYNEALDRPWEPEEVVDSYRRQFEQAQDEVRLARLRYRDALDQVSAGSYDRQLIEADITATELRIERLERGIDPLLALEVERAQLNVAQLEQRIANARLIAPFAGEVLSLQIKAGDAVQAYSGVAVLADPADLEISADLNAEDLAELSVGQPADIALRNRPNDPLTGSVRQLPAAFSGSNVSNDNDESTRVAFDAPPDGLEIGELANVTITLQEKEDVLWLPPAAIRTFQGRTFVVVEEDGNRRRVDVRVGIAGDDRVEIIEGVAAGATVIGE